MRFIILLIVFGLARRYAQPRRVLYVTHSAGFRHGSIETSIDVLQRIAATSGALEVVATEDVSQISSAGLSGFDAVFFFTSGELPISDSQKQDLLAFIRGGKGFGGVHSATDTLYTWPEYGELIGARFNGHPWVQSVRIDIEDPDHPAVSHLQPAFSIMDEIYQFRDFSRDRVRVLMTLGTQSVDMNAEGANPGIEDFPLAWCRNYGQGRVFYSALGHFDETWRDERFQRTLLNALLWITGQIDGNATPRPGTQPELIPEGAGNSASFTPRMAISAGSLLSIFGHNLTSGSTMKTDGRDPAVKLAGTTVKLDGTPIPLLYVSPGQVNAYVPLSATPRQCPPVRVPGISCFGPVFDLELAAAGGGAATASLQALEATPGIFAVEMTPTVVTLWATGMGPVERRGGLDLTRTQPGAIIGGVPARVLFSGLSPDRPGVYQVNIELPPNLPSPALLEFQFGNYEQQAWLQPVAGGP